LTLLISVTFTFEAESIEEAQDIVATWTVTPGVQMLGLLGTAQGARRPVNVRMGGAIGSSMRAAQREFDEDMLSTPVRPAPGGPTQFPGPQTTVFPPPATGNGNGD
jgi:hypothetical protein